MLPEPAPPSWTIAAPSPCLRFLRVNGMGSLMDCCSARYEADSSSKESWPMISTKSSCGGGSAVATAATARFVCAAAGSDGWRGGGESSLSVYSMSSCLKTGLGRRRGRRSRSARLIGGGLGEDDTDRLPTATLYGEKASERDSFSEEENVMWWQKRNAVCRQKGTGGNTHLRTFSEPTSTPLPPSSAH